MKSPVVKRSIVVAGHKTSVSLEEAFKGSQKTINVPSSVACDTCHGTGAEGGAEPVTCPTCNGMGQIVKNPCKVCGGAGRVEKERALSVNIPPGVETGNFPAMSEAAAKRIPNARLVRFADLGHSPQIQDPARFHKALLEGLAAR